MATRVEVGTIVRLKSGEDGVVLDILETGLGYREFSVLTFDCGQTRCVNRLQLDPIIAEEGVEVESLLKDALFEAEPAETGTSRFAEVHDECELDALADGRLSKTTKRQTGWAVRTFRDWMVASGNEQYMSFEDLDEETLADVLRRFYFCARTKQGERYSRSAYKNLRAGIHRYLQSAPHNKLFNILKDRTFQRANQVYEGYMSKIREEGKDKSQSKATIEPGDVTKLYETVFDDTPVGLQYCVFYELCLHFGRRGREGLRELRKDSFECKKNDKGEEYIGKAYHEKEKTKRGLAGQEKEKEGFMFAVPGDKNCPVLNFKRYIEKLNPLCESFFQRPRAKCYEGGIWYDNIAVGCHTLNKMMKSMSQAGGLSQLYTNHCIRKTCVTALGNAGFEAKDIMSLTGHKSVSSLEPYIGATSMSRKKTMSDALHSYSLEANAMSRTAPTATCTSTNTPAPSITETPPAPAHEPVPGPSCTPPPAVSHPVYSLSILDSPAAHETVESMEVVHNSQDGTSQTTAMRMVQKASGSLFSGAVFNNCTFNMSFSK